MIHFKQGVSTTCLHSLRRIHLIHELHITGDKDNDDDDEDKKAKTRQP